MIKHILKFKNNIKYENFIYLPQFKTFIFINQGELKNENI